MEFILSVWLKEDIIGHGYIYAIDSGVCHFVSVAQSDTIIMQGLEK